MEVDLKQQTRETIHGNGTQIASLVSLLLGSIPLQAEEQITSTIELAGNEQYWVIFPVNVLLIPNLLSFHLHPSSPHHHS